MYGATPLQPLYRKSTELLIAALKQGKFHAVALDVYEGEDANVYTDHSFDVPTEDITGRLLMFPQVILTSHQAFFTREALQAIAEKYGSSPKAWLIVSIVGAFLIDLINALAITWFGTL